MSKQLELIYSRQSTDFIQGRAYANPRYFTTPRSGVSKVFIVGEWPDIVAAYTALGVPVERLDQAPAAVATVAVPAPAAPVDTGSVQIPDDWRGLPWSKGNGGLTLRGLASSVSPVPVINSAMAIAAIEAELKRRVVEILDPLDRPNDDANGLTLRELRADIAGLGLDVDPTMSPPDLLALRDLHREERAKDGE